jgi:hypothetical protein
MEKNLILKSGFRLFRVDNYEDIRNEKVVRITCAEQGDDIDWEDDASYFPTKEEILLIIKKLEESIIYIEKQRE